MSPRRLAWVVMAVALVGLFAVAVSDNGDGTSPEERSQRIAESIACPTCDGQSVADSDAPAARAVRDEIERGVADGKSAEQIRAELANSYGDAILLTPERGGIAGLVWALPVAVLLIALAGIGYAFWRWRGTAAPTVSDADRDLVDRALDDLKANR